MYTKKVELSIPAYYFETVGKFQDADTGEALPDDYFGLCVVYSRALNPAIHYTGLTKSGERFWHCIKSNID